MTTLDAPRSPISPEHARRFRVVSAICGALVACAGAVALAGWILASPTLKGLWASEIDVKANTAVLLLLSGVALILLAPTRVGLPRRLAGRGLALVAVAIGLATLGEHLFGWDLGIDQILFREAPGALGSQSPNRMGPPASICFPLLGAALLLLDARTSRGRVPSQWIALLALIVVSIPLLGYIFHVPTLYGVAQYTGIALHTAIAFALLGVGILLARADGGAMRLLAAADSGGILLRRLLPASILLPIVLAWLRVQGEKRGWFDADFGRTLLVLSFIVVFSALVWWSAAAISRLSIARARAEAAEGEALLRLRDTLDSEREARAAAERSNRMKDEFLATLSHELRTPLNAILGWATLLARGGLAPADVRRGLEAIERNSRLQAQLIEDLLDMSRIVSGQIRLDVGDVDLAGLVDAAVAAALPSAHAKGIRIERRLGPVGNVRGDPERLEQVLWNLISNAIKFTPPEGRVDIGLRAIDEWVELTVADTGIGIRREFLSHVFDRFAQADASTTRRQGGLGLGLPIARQITELHGGTLEAESEGENRGARFVVRLPRVPRIASDGEDARPAAASEAVADAVDLGGLRILVVDDQPDSRELIERVLRQRGAEVALADGTDRALELLGAARWDVLVSDIGMPGRDGYELIRAVRADGGGPPAIALTAFVRPEDRERALAAGFQRHVPKPVQPAALLRAISDLTRRRRTVG